MKKCISILILTGILFSFAGCGQFSSSSDQTKAVSSNEIQSGEEGTAETVGETSETVSETVYYGTWKTVSIEKNNATVSIEELEKQGNNTCSFTLILQKGGKYCFYSTFNSNQAEFGEWIPTAEGIKADTDNMPFKNGMLCLILEDSRIVYLKKTSDSQTFPVVVSEKKDADWYCGTWKTAGIEKDGVTMTADALEKQGNKGYLLTLILRKDGKVCMYPSYTVTDAAYGSWSTTSEGIKCGSMLFYNKNDFIWFVTEDQMIVYLKKASASQDFPVLQQETNELRAEFKEAMDSYEAFINQYCSFMERYKENPTDLSLLTQYASMLSQYSKMSQSFDQWEDEDLNDAELKYYLEVQSRVTQKILNISM